MGTSDERGHGAPTTLAWQTQLRVSRCRGLGYCVIEVHEFDVETPGKPARARFRVYRDALGFPVGSALASFGSLGEAQRHAECLGGNAAREERTPSLTRRA